MLSHLKVSGEVTCTPTWIDHACLYKQENAQNSTPKIDPAAFNNSEMSITIVIVIVMVMVMKYEQENGPVGVQNHHKAVYKL